MLGKDAGVESVRTKVHSRCLSSCELPQCRRCGATSDVRPCYSLMFVHQRWLNLPAAPLLVNDVHLASPTSPRCCLNKPAAFPSAFSLPLYSRQRLLSFFLPYTLFQPHAAFSI